jgi:peroxiredoxin
MYPHERSLVQRLKDEAFTIIGVNSDPAEDYRAAIERENITWPSFWDGGDTSGPIATKWGVHGWPTLFIIDWNGIIREKNKRGEEMDKVVDALLAEMKTKH